MNEDRFLIILLIILSIIVFVDIGRRINTYFQNNIITIRGTNKGLNVGVHENFETGNNSTYNRYLYRIMMQNWKNPLDDEDVHAEIQAIINRNGKLTSYQLTKSSNNLEYDRAAINTLLNTSPFQPFLEGMGNNERLFTFYFNGSRAGANGFDRGQRITPLEIKVDQSSKRTTHPRIQDIKSARIDCNGSYCYCNVWDKWRPSLTETSKISIDFTINKDRSVTIKNVEKINDALATEKAVEAVKSVKCENYPEQYPRDMKYTFFVENRVYNR